MRAETLTRVGIVQINPHRENDCRGNEHRLHRSVNQRTSLELYVTAKSYEYESNSCQAMAHTDPTERTNLTHMMSALRHPPNDQSAAGRIIYHDRVTLRCHNQHIQPLCPACLCLARDSNHALRRAIHQQSEVKYRPHFGVTFRCPQSASARTTTSASFIHFDSIELLSAWRGYTKRASHTPPQSSSKSTTP